MLSRAFPQFEDGFITCPSIGFIEEVAVPNVLVPFYFDAALSGLTIVSVEGDAVQYENYGVEINGDCTIRLQYTFPTGGLK